MSSINDALHNVMVSAPECVNTIGALISLPGENCPTDSLLTTTQ